MGTCFRSRFFGIPRASRAGARAQLTAPTCARWRDARVRRRSACTEARHLFSLPADEGTRSEGGVFVSRERLPGGAPPGWPGGAFVRAARAERDSRGLPRPWGPGRRRARPRRGRRCVASATRARSRAAGGAGSGAVGPTRFFSRRARRTTLTLAPNRRERRRRAPERTARGRPRRSARSARKTRSTRYAERHEPVQRPRRVPNRVASPNPRRSRENRAHRAGPLGASCTRRPPLLFHRAFPPIRFFAPRPSDER